uniref:Variant surface glycoprotein 1122 n=1 Tax=Trypanosoma brucei TaxID=5691 RepID=M4SZD0_9TRYP|nr:variant surface glycoprotein 1122 [Trypanosoma brucei]
MKLKEQALLLWICFALSTPAAKCAVNEGDNGQYYSVTCTILNMLTSGFPQADTPNSVQSLASEIGALNLPLSDQQFSNLIAHDKDWGEAPMKAATDNKPYTQDWQARYPFWKAAATKIKEQEAVYKAWQTLKLSSAAIHMIRDLAHEAYEAYTDTELNSFAPTQAALTAAANKAIHGKDSNGDNEQSPTTSDRVNDCGKANGNPDDKAGKNLKTDLFCLCAGTNAQVAKPCCTECSDASASDDWDDTATKVPKAWQRIRANCPTHAPTLRLNTENMQRALAAFQQIIAPMQGTTAKKQYILGTLDGTGAGGCTGSSAATNGVCVIYKSTTSNNVIEPTIDWVRHALKAAEQGTKLMQRDSHIKQLEAKLRILNITASLQKHKVISQHQATEGTSQKKGTQGTSENENNCNKHHSDAVNCTTAGCDYDANAKDGKKCKPKAGKESTATGTVPTTGCAKHGTDKTACEKDKTGDKQNCA